MMTPWTEHITNLYARDALFNWQKACDKNCYTHNLDFVHLMQNLFTEKFVHLHQELEAYAELVIKELEPLVNDNHHVCNLPRLKQYNIFGKNSNAIIYHPSYLAAGDIVYQAEMLKRMAKAGGLTECLAFLFLSSHAGEAGHHCAIACSAGMIRVLQRVSNPNAKEYIEKLTTPDYYNNFTAAQFVTEIQGGCDVGANATSAEKHEDHYKIYGEKWFCSNAGADLLFVVARYHEDIEGTKGLALFLVPAKWNEKSNHYRLRRLKDKMGTQTLPTAEIEFNGAHGYLMGDLSNSFNLLMNPVLHLSRLFNSICVLGMARRAFDIAYAYAQHRIAFSKAIIEYPLIKETLAIIQTENNAMLAAIFSTAKLQDHYDLNEDKNLKEQQLLLRLLVNIQKYNTAKLSLKHIQYALSILAGNGTIQNFSPIPRLLKDCIICDNWEGTHNILRHQVLRDMHKYKVDEIFLAYLHDELAKLKQYKEPLLKAYHHLASEIKNFKLDSFELQSLNIRHVVDAMCHLYNATLLLKDALGNDSAISQTKLNYFHFYCQRHFLSESKHLNEEYLMLINKIVND